ncbi:hypothetical protein [Frateuria soli]|uniref:hypothetical protein n=1 Tax=Frateuria soli TaxID=1542730 RepID=UPI001E2DA194|nr:hypothetical protein [Frateuria soli]UGB39014.1 hypothetical protein LQ771_03975 [Frateuria soli]
MAYGEPPNRRPSPPTPPPDAAPLLAAAQRHLDSAGVSACVVRSPDGDLMVAAGSPSDRLFAMLAQQASSSSGDRSA